MFLWTLVPGDTIDLKHVAKLEPISYTATCSSVVDVMFVSSHEILPQKDSSTEPLLDKETIEKLRQGEDVTIPDYNYVTCKRNPVGLERKWSPLVIFEGIFGLYDKWLNQLFDLKIFVHTDDDIRLARRLNRDIVERGRTVEGVLKSYHRYVKPAFSEFVKPTMKYADIIVPRGRPEIQTEQN